MSTFSADVEFAWATVDDTAPLGQFTSLESAMRVCENHAAQHGLRLNRWRPTSPDRHVTGNEAFRYIVRTHR